MASYASKNRQVIKNAFNNLLKDEKEIIRDGMCKLAEAGLSYLIEAHEFHSALMNHTTETDTMGYAVAFDGVIVASGSHDGGGDDMPGAARDTAQALLAGTQGWVAIILSDMEGWYRVDYEEDFLGYAFEEVKANFNQFFKRISK